MATLPSTSAGNPPRTQGREASTDGACYIAGVALGAALGGAVLVLVMAGAVWPLALVMIAGGAGSLALARRGAAARAERSGRATTPGPATTGFRDWSAEGSWRGLGDGALPIASASGAASLPARSTIVDSQA